MFDTHVLETYLENNLPEFSESTKYMRCLPYLLRKYKLNYEENHLHNAGCDAFYNMMVFLRQMGYSAEKVNDLIEYYYEY
jgi:phosphoglycerol transferase MdoB-like AlkP superfamily enzyme